MLDLAHRGRGCGFQQDVFLPVTLAAFEKPDREILKGLLNTSPKFYTGDKALMLNDYIDFHEPNQVERCWQTLKRIEEEIIFNE